MSLLEWTVWRVSAAWVLWVVLACAGALAAMVMYARAHEPPSPSTTSHATGPVIGPSYSIALNGWIVLGVLVGPPVLLTAGWLWQRHQHQSAAT